jgi:hypothetical protein
MILSKIQGFFGKSSEKSPKFSTDYHCQAGGQNWLFCKTWVVVSWCGFANVPMCGWLKLFLKCAVGKILKTFGSVCESACLPVSIC